MGKMKMVLMVAGVLLLAAGAEASTKVIRAVDLGATVWNDISSGKLSDVIVEFRQGDELPISFSAEGDLLETTRPSVSYITVKRNFWLRLSQNDIEISLDGTGFKKISQVLSGSIQAGAGSDQNGGVANSINIMLKAFLK